MFIDNYEERIAESSVLTDPHTPIISIPVFRCSKSHQSCVICGIEIISAKVLSSVQRTMIFLKRGVFVSPGSRCWSEHVVKKQLTVESFDKGMGAQQHHAQVMLLSSVHSLGIACVSALFYLNFLPVEQDKVYWEVRVQLPIKLTSCIMKQYCHFTKRTDTFLTDLMIV
ncbi:unnamed protein product [Rotaria socialis]